VTMALLLDRDQSARDKGLNSKKALILARVEGTDGHQSPSRRKRTHKKYKISDVTQTVWLKQAVKRQWTRQMTGGGGRARGRHTASRMCRGQARCP
jgi:hypothetical protein